MISGKSFASEIGYLVFNQIYSLSHSSAIFVVECIKQGDVPGEVSAALDVGVDLFVDGGLQNKWVIFT